MKPNPRLTLMNKEVILGLVRHVLTALGGSLVTNGTLSDSALEAGIGAVMTLIGIVWSVRQKTMVNLK